MTGADLDDDPFGTLALETVETVAVPPRDAMTTLFEELGGNGKKPSDGTPKNAALDKNPTDGTDVTDGKYHAAIKSTAIALAGSPQEPLKNASLGDFVFHSSLDGDEREQFILWSGENYPQPQKRKGKRQGNQLLGLARLIKFHPASPFKGVAYEDVLGEYLTHIPEYLESDGFADNFIKAMEAAKIPLDYHPVKDAIAAVAANPRIQFPSKRAKVLRRYNLFLNMLIHLRALIPDDEDIFLSCHAISKVFIAAGFKLSPDLIASYIKWAIADGCLERTAAHNYARAARYRYRGARVLADARLRGQLEDLSRRIELLERKRKAEANHSSHS